MASVYVYRLLAISLLLLCACQPDASKEQSATSATAAPAAAALAEAPAQTPTRAQRFLPLIRGSWVNRAYLAAVRQTKSPLRAFAMTGAVSEMQIKPSDLTADSLVVSLGLGNHEGGGMSVYFRPGQTSSSLPTSYRDYDAPGSFAELSYQLNAPDTILWLTTYTRSRQVISRASYQRVPGAPADQLGALNKAVDQLLFVGTYTGADSLGRPARVQFGADGSVQGINGVARYYTSTDFGSGPGNDLDHLILDAGTKHARRINYTHRHDTLRLFAAQETLRISPAQDTIPTLVRGKLLFTLVRR